MIKKIISHPLFAGSVIMIFGSTFTSFINYVYHLVMGRLLGPSLYGELAALISLIGLIGIVPLSLSLVVTKFVSAAKTEYEMNNLINWFNNKVLFIGFFIFIFLLALTPILTNFLKISSPWLIILTGIYFVVSLPLIFNRAILQGLLRFKQAVVSMVVENITKLLLGVIAVLVGFSVIGATAALSITALVAWVITVYYMKSYLKKGEHQPLDLKPLLAFAFPVLIQSVATTSIYSTDLILVKHFFPPHQAGLYASLSFLGRIIFFGASPISLVMFPLISQRKSKGEKYRKIFLLSLLAVSGICALILLIYYLFPFFVINLLYGRLYLEAAPYLVLFGLFISLFTVSFLIINYFLAIGKAKVTVVPLVVALLQIVGITIFHNNLAQVIEVSLAVSFLLLGTLGAYYFINLSK